MRRPFPAFVVVAALLAAGFVFAGCTHTITLQERTASFTRHEAARIDNLPARQFLLERIAVLMSGAEVTTKPETELEVTFAAKDPQDLGFGTATAIDARGYLLTAAHCVKHQPVFLFFINPEKKPHVERARVVWQGNAGQGEPDLAILHVTQRLAPTAEWSTDFKRGDAVLAAGLNYEEAFHFDAGCIAGELTKTERRTRATPAYDHIYHQAPLHGGDSGGPLITTAGRLIGINTGSGAARLGPFKWIVARAERPDLPWLRRLIDEDFAQWHHGATRGAE